MHTRSHLWNYKRVALGSIFLVGIAGLLLMVALPRTSVSSTYESAEKTHIVAPAPLLSTDVWGLFDPETGVVRVGAQVDDSRPIASVTKLFTGAVIMQQSTAHDAFTIQDTDLGPDGRAGKLTSGQKVTPYSLLYPMLIESSNDAAEAVRRHLGDSFIRTQAELLQSLQLQQTSLVDASGLSAKDISTVHDLARFFAYLKKSTPHLLDITQLNIYVDEHTGYVNNNPARGFDSFSGGKNGYTPEAGHTFVGSFMIPGSTEEIGIVLLASDDLHSDIAALLMYRESFMGNSDIIAQ